MISALLKPHGAASASIERARRIAPVPRQRDAAWSGPVCPAHVI